MNLRTRRERRFPEEREFCRHIIQYGRGIYREVVERFRADKETPLPIIFEEVLARVNADASPLHFGSMRYNS